MVPRKNNVDQAEVDEELLRRYAAVMSPAQVRELVLADLRNRHTHL